MLFIRGYSPTLENDSTAMYTIKPDDNLLLLIDFNRTDRTYVILNIDMRSKVLFLKHRTKCDPDIKSIPIQGGLQVSVEYNGTTFTIRVYKNNKNIRVYYSQTQPSLVEKNLEVVSDEPCYESPKPDVLIAGFDESGKEDIFGGIMFSGVYIDKPYDVVLELLSAIGIKDSKDMSDDEVVRAYKILTNMSGVTIVTKYCDPMSFNKAKKEGKKVNIIMQDFHLKTISDLLQNVDAQLPNAILIEQIPNKGENLLVAAASVVANYNYLNKMDDLGLEYGMELPRGTNEYAKAFYHNSIEPVFPDDIKGCLMKDIL